MFFSLAFRKPNATGHKYELVVDESGRERRRVIFPVDKDEEEDDSEDEDSDDGNEIKDITSEEENAEDTEEDEEDKNSSYLNKV